MSILMEDYRKTAYAKRMPAPEEAEAMTLVELAKRRKEKFIEEGEHDRG